MQVLSRLKPNQQFKQSRLLKRVTLLQQKRSKLLMPQLLRVTKNRQLKRKRRSHLQRRPLQKLHQLKQLQPRLHLQSQHQLNLLLWKQHQLNLPLLNLKSQLQRRQKRKLSLKHRLLRNQSQKTDKRKRKKMLLSLPSSSQRSKNLKKRINQNRNQQKK